MLKRPLNFILLFLTAALFSCHSGQKPVKEFEGVITFKTSYSSWRDTINGPYTDTLRVYYSQGRILRVHSGDSSIAPKTEIYPTAGEKFYSTRSKADTLFWYDITENPKMELARFEVIADEKPILGHKCESVNVWIKHTDRANPYYVKHQYIFSRGYLPVDKDKLSDFKYAYFDQVVEEAGSYYLGYEYKLYAPNKAVLYAITYKAISVKEQKLDPKIFELPKLPLKEAKN